MTARALATPDREALLAALVLAPATYSRNRFFELYQDAELRRVRRRATQIRSVVRHLTRASVAEPGELVSLSPSAGDRFELRYEVATIGLTRTILIDAMELSLVRFAIARARNASAPPPNDPDRARIEAALARLAPGVGGSHADAGHADAGEAPL